MLSADGTASRHLVGTNAQELIVYGPALAPGRQGRKARQRESHTPHSFPPGRHGSSVVPPELPILPPTDQVGRPSPCSCPGLASPQPPFRFWIDEVLWSQGRVAVALIEQVLEEAGGFRTGGPSREQERARKRQQQLELQLATGGAGVGSGFGAVGAGTGGGAGGGGPLGSQHMRSWEVLWTKSTYAIPAARTMRPGQLVSAIIGLNSLTMKRRLLLTLRGALGEAAAFAITPRTFALPEELGAWEEWVRGSSGRERRRRGSGAAGGEEGEGEDEEGEEEELWILKTGQDAGKGLTLLPARMALRYARQQLLGGAAAAGSGTTTAATNSNNNNNSSKASKSGADGPQQHPPQHHQQQPQQSRTFPLQVAQRYVAEPLLLGGRKFHLRLWVLVTAHRPLRAYLHRRGLVLFSSEPYNPSDAATAAAAATATPATASSSFPLPASHITNYARNANSLVWSLDQLRNHMGAQRFGALWTALCRSCAQALAAARSSLAEAHAWLNPAVQEYGFQMMGVDFLLDRRDHPWLLEFNSSPSIMVQHDNEGMRRLIYEEKYGMLRDTWELVRRRVFTDEGGGGEDGSGGDGRLGGRRRVVSVAQAEADCTGVEYEPLMPYMT